MDIGLIINDSKHHGLARVGVLIKSIPGLITMAMPIPEDIPLV